MELQLAAQPAEAHVVGVPRSPGVEHRTLFVPARERCPVISAIALDGGELAHRRGHAGDGGAGRRQPLLPFAQLPRATELGARRREVAALEMDATEELERPRALAEHGGIGLAALADRRQILHDLLTDPGEEL